jgi:hypothetical protein
MRSVLKRYKKIKGTKAAKIKLSGEGSQLLMPSSGSNRIK